MDIEALGQGMPKLGAYCKHCFCFLLDSSHIKESNISCLTVPNVDILDLGGSPIRDFSVINGENFPSLRKTCSICDALLFLFVCLCRLTFSRSPRSRNIVHS